MVLMVRTAGVHGIETRVPDPRRVRRNHTRRNTLGILLCRGCLVLWPSSIYAWQFAAYLSAASASSQPYLLSLPHLTQEKRIPSSPVHPHSTSAVALCGAHSVQPCSTGSRLSSL
jgi:hypothetical protein